jgi:hypothetical protein
MCISEKTAFFIVTAVKTSNLRRTDDVRRRYIQIDFRRKFLNIATIQIQLFN